MTSSLNPLALPLAQQDSLAKSDSVSSLTSNQTTLMSSLAGASTPTAEPGMVDASGVAPLNTVIDLVGGAVQHLRLAVNPQAASTSIIDLGSNVPYFLDAPKAPTGTQPLAMTALPGSAIAVDASYIPPSPATIIPNGSPTVGPTLVSSITGGMKINLVWDSTIDSSTSGLAFQASMVAAAQLLCNTMSDKITINLGITCSGTGGGAKAGPSDNGIFVDYATVKADLVAKKTPGDTTFDNLPATTSVQGQTLVAVWGAQEKALGILDGAATGLDGSATFATDIAPNLLLGVALHELTHAMGRVPYGPQPDIFDLFRFSSPGVMLFAQNKPSSVAYFSLDAGRTNLINFGVTSDPSDFFQATGNDPFSEYYTASTLQTLTAVDKKMLDALGFHVGVLPPTPPTKGNIVTFLANLSTIEATSYALTDSSANIALNIDALHAHLGLIASITQTSPAALALSATQLSADVDVLTKIGTYKATVSGVAAANVSTVLSNSNVTSLAVSDTSADIVTNIAALQANIAKITAIVVSPVAPLGLSATQLSADADVLTKIGSYTATVSGVAAANVSTVLSNSKVTSLAVSDTSADIVTNIAALQANIAKITAIVVSPAAPLGLSATQFSADATALTKMGAFTATVSGVLAVNVGAVLSNTHVTSIVVSDTSANIVANLDAIQKLVAIPANSAKISSIASSDGQNLNVSAIQLASDSTALAKVKFSDISVTGIVPNSSQTLSGSLGNVIFNFGVAMPGSPTALRLDTINSWSGHDEISFSSPLNIVGSSAAPKSGMASIASTGFATFVPGDSSVALQLAAVENALAYGQPTGVVAMGDLAMWFNGADAYVLITSNHTGTGVGSNDTFIKLAGVNSTDRLVFASGVIAV